MLVYPAQPQCCSTGPVGHCCHKLSESNNNVDKGFEALKSRQEVYIKNNDTHKDSTFFSAGSTVMIYLEDGGTYMHGVIIKDNSSNH